MKSSMAPLQQGTERRRTPAAQSAAGVRSRPSIKPSRRAPFLRLLLFYAVIVGIAMVKTAYDLYTDQFEWKRDAYEYEFGKNPFDVVSGTDTIRKAIEAGASLDEITAAWEPRASEFAEVRKGDLLY